MSTRSRTLAVALVAARVIAAPPVSAQAHDTSYGRRALARFLSRVQADGRLPDSLRSITTGRLDSLPIRYFAQLDDSSEGLYVRSMVAVLRQLPESLCAEVAFPSEENGATLLGVLSAVDSATVDSLLLVHELALLGATRPTPLAVAEPGEMQQAIGRLVAALTPADQQRFLFVAQNPPPSLSDACWEGRALFGGLAQLPPAQLGPVLRRMTARPAPRD